MSNCGLYVHIPFCERKCKYCSFVSFMTNDKTQENYFCALKKEICSVKTDKIITSIYFGGGTPSCVSDVFICETLKLIFEQFKVKKNAEITIECNPNSISKKKLENYKKAGFNRVSFGAQSFDDNVLQKLGRLHSSKQIFEAITFAKSAGFNNISLDLILGVSKFENLESNIEKIKKLGITHISAYMLMLENGTKLFEEVKSGNEKILTDDESVLEYNKAVKVLKKFGFNRYEISNFALKSYESKHNLNYWQCGEYLGFGVSANSYFDGVRFANTSDLGKYCTCDFGNNSVIEQKEKLTIGQKIEECIMLGLRTKYGVSFKNLLKFGYDIQKEKKKEILELLKLKAISVSKTKIKITPKFYGVINQIILMLI